ncbi:hypothetical protein AHAS_Ahas16G0222200 [Arachis hypogaea]
MKPPISFSKVQSPSFNCPLPLTQPQPKKNPSLSSFVRPSSHCRRPSHTRALLFVLSAFSKSPTLVLFFRELGICRLVSVVHRSQWSLTYSAQTLKGQFTVSFSLGLAESGSVCASYGFKWCHKLLVTRVTIFLKLAK